MNADESALPDLASRRMGGSVIAASDELFAERENLIKAEAPTHEPSTFGPKGQRYDGWETRRRREAGDDWAIIRLGLPGVIRRLIIDTAYFKGNYPPEVSVEAAGVEGYPSPAELLAAGWVTLVARAPLTGDALTELKVRDERRFTHVRLVMHPDGGIARLRVHGEPVPDPRLLPAADLDLAALANGASITGCSNLFYAAPSNLISPGLARSTGEGWETARRRGAGNDWVELRLAGAGVIRFAEIDTSCFIGNAPGWAGLTGFDERTDPTVRVELLTRTRLQPDTVHVIRLAAHPEVTHVRLDVFPDGGLARLRLRGRLSDEARAELASRWFSRLPASQAVELLLSVCHSRRWADSVAAARPLADLAALQDAADSSWQRLGPDDWRQALDGHPRIGESGGSSPQFSAQEQVGVATAEQDVKEAIAQGNRDYEERFGHVFLIAAAGRTADQILQNLTVRLGNDPETELRVAAEQHRLITRLRLQQLLG
jgi:allantoicase